MRSTVLPVLTVLLPTLRYSRVTTHGTVELIVEKFSEFRVCFPYFEGGCICRYNDQFVINQIDRCCTDPITYPFKGKSRSQNWYRRLADMPV